MGLIATLTGEPAVISLKAGESCAVLSVERNGFLSYLRTVPSGDAQMVHDYLVVAMQQELGLLNKTCGYHEQFERARKSLRSLFS